MQVTNRGASRYTTTYVENEPRDGDSAARSMTELSGKYDRDDRELAVGHFLGHVQNQLAIFLVGFAQQTAKLVEEARLFAAAAPGNVVRRLALRQVGQHGRFFAVVEELIERALESASQLFQRLDSRNSMAILDAGDITTKQAGTLFDITLGEFLFLTQSAEAVTNNHGGIMACR
jgi:hypothetical protein